MAASIILTMLYGPVLCILKFQVVFLCSSISALVFLAIVNPQLTVSGPVTSEARGLPWWRCEWTPVLTLLHMLS